jgi:hypothetical protein
LNLVKAFTGPWESRTSVSSSKIADNTGQITSVRQRIGGDIFDVLSSNSPKPRCSRRNSPNSSSPESRIFPPSSISRAGWNAERAAANLEIERIAAAPNATLAELHLSRGFVREEGKRTASLRAALYPRAWFFQRVAQLNRRYDRRIAQFDAANGRIDFTPLDWSFKQELVESEGDPPGFRPMGNRVWARRNRS